MESALLIVEIDESRCIGCTLCIEACPEQAIVGAARMVHTVWDLLCTGCQACIPACPIACISPCLSAVAAAKTTPASAKSEPSPSPRFTSALFNLPAEAIQELQTLKSELLAKFIP